MISSELILALLVPPLVFEGALHIEWKRFRNNLDLILLMSVPGVILGTFIVGWMVVGIEGGVLNAARNLHIAGFEQLIPIPLAAAIAFGALISATDPVAVIAFFRSLGVDKRLSTLVEGESLLNDGTSIVIFNLAVAIGGASFAQTAANPVKFDLLLSTLEFLKVSIGGAVVGIAISWLAGVVLSRTNNRLVETTITIVVAFGSYVLAQTIGVSGIIAVMAAGIYLGTVIPPYTTPTTKIALFNFWEVLSFVFTSFLFLMIGWIIDIREVFTLQNLVLLLAGVAAVLTARFLIVYGMAGINNLGTLLQRRFRKVVRRQMVPFSFQHIMFWGGLRGAISLALVLSLSPNQFGTGVGTQIQLMTFGVLLFTLIVQGTTIGPLVKRLGLSRKSPSQLEKELTIGRYYTALAAQKELERLHENGILTGSLWEAMHEAQKEERTEYDLMVRNLLYRYPNLSFELAVQARYLILEAERTALNDAVKREVISDQAEDELLRRLDDRIRALDIINREQGDASLLTDEDAGGSSL